jgi:uncharacterized protein
MNCQKYHIRADTIAFMNTRIRVVAMVSLVAMAALAQEEKKTAPQYEMRMYVFGTLKRGPNAGKGDKAEQDKIQAGHMANIQKMAAAGKLIVAGPMGDDGDLRGIFIFDAKSVDEVKAMAEEDPAIKAGRLVLELHPWYAAAGLRVSGPK